MAENGEKERRGPYKVLKKHRIIHEIQILLSEGYNNEYIRQRLKRTPRTYSRYKALMYQNEKAALLGLDIDTVLEKILSSELEFKAIKQKFIELSSDKTMDGSSRVLALQSAVETVRQSLVLYVDLPNYLNKLSGSPEAIQETLARLERKRKQQQQKQKQQEQSVQQSASPTQHYNAGTWH